MKLETSPKVTKSKRSVVVSVNKYLCRLYYSISQKVITLSGRIFTVSGVFITLSGTYYIIGSCYYIIGHVLPYRAFITISVGTRFLTGYRSAVSARVACSTLAKYAVYAFATFYTYGAVLTSEVTASNGVFIFR